MDITRFIPNPSDLLHFAMSTVGSALSRLSSPTGGIPRALPNAHFDIDIENGFLPSEAIGRLPTTFDFWERALSEAGKVLSLGEDDTDDGLSRRDAGERWRQRLREGPILSTITLETDASQLKRAHLVLAYLVQFYVHSTPPTDSSTPMVVPKTLAVPLVTVSQHLGIAPVLTYADTVLWNMAPINPELPIGHKNIRFMHLFSRTREEEDFYIASAGVELRGAEILRIIEDYHNLPNVNDIGTISKISRSLYRVAGIIDELSDIMQSVRAGCDPHVFYWAVRPWYRGSDADGPEAPGWIYEGVDNYDQLDLSGPSAGQSSMMHALDIWLDVDHKLRQRRAPAPSESNKKADKGFMERMRRYMPGIHQEYLRQLADSPRPLRELAHQTPPLRDPYNAAMKALKKLRDGHMRIACLYIITQSKSSPASRRGCPVSAMMDKMRREDGVEKGPVRGTGGTELAVLLKAGRDATQRSILE